jgi:adenylate kinase
MIRQVIILFGPPGAGKGTQAELLADKLNLYYFETSKILEEKFRQAEEEMSKDKAVVKVDGKEYNILVEKKLWQEGVLCSPPFVAYLVQTKIEELFQEGKNLVLAGSPRTVYEAEKIMPVLGELYRPENIKVILLEISPEETIFRNSHRRICQLVRHPILYNEETKDLKTCPLDGSALTRRKGLDDPETIKTRLKEYQERTKPVLEIFKNKGIKVERIDGGQTVADVFRDVSKTINFDF